MTVCPPEEQALRPCLPPGATVLLLRIRLAHAHVQRACTVKLR